MLLKIKYLSLLILFLCKIHWVSAQDLKYEVSSFYIIDFFVKNNLICLKSDDLNFSQAFGSSQFKAANRIVVMVALQNQKYIPSLLVDNTLISTTGKKTELDKDAPELNFEKYHYIQSFSRHENNFLLNDFSKTEFPHNQAINEVFENRGIVMNTEQNVLYNNQGWIFPVTGGYLLSHLMGPGQLSYSLLNFNCKSSWFNSSNYSEIIKDANKLWMLHRMENGVCSYLSKGFVKVKTEQVEKIYSCNLWSAKIYGDKDYRLVIPLKHEKACIVLKDNGLGVLGLSTSFNKKLKKDMPLANYLKISPEALAIDNQHIFGDFSISNSIAEVWKNGDEIYFTEKHQSEDKESLSQDTAWVYHKFGSLMAKGNKLNYQPNGILLIHSNASGQARAYLFPNGIASKPLDYADAQLYESGVVVMDKKGNYGFVLHKGSLLFEVAYKKIWVFGNVVGVAKTINSTPEILHIDGSKPIAFNEVSQAEICENGKALKIQKDGKWGLLAIDGKELMKPSKERADELICPK